MKHIWMAAVILAIWLLTGCGRSTSVASEDGSSVSVSENGDGVEFTLRSGDAGDVHVVANESGVSLPEDFPKDVPTYPGATVTASTTMPQGMNVSLKTADPVSKVVSFYQKHLKANGWKVQTALNGPERNMAIARKDGRTTTTMIVRHDAVTTVSLTLATK